jgi:predicted ATPase/DNA-binding SARP family transcriptional activator
MKSLIRRCLPALAREADHAWVSADSPPTAGGTSVFELRLLGPVRVSRAGREVALGGPRQRVVLALLLLEAGRVMPAGWLVEEVWRGCPPPTAAKTLRSYVSRLRSLLSPEIDLVGRGGGYVITVDPDHVDAGRFERLTAAGQAALRHGRAEAAAVHFGDALALWSGRALADVCDVEPLALEAIRLEELRLAAVEGKIEANIALGRHAEVVGELERLVAEHPLRERMWRLLVLALYRCERQADALAAYRRARAVLAEELGLEPNEELRQLEQAVLRQEVPAIPPPARHNLPAPLTSFLGREQDLAALEAILGRVRLVTLTGPGGAGKTRLALELAAGMLGRFADGAWLADLAGVSSPRLVAVQVMAALGVRQAGEVPVMQALDYRLRSADLLLVLDNCEHLLDACADLTRALLRNSRGLRVLATSREPLGIPGEVVYPVRPLAVPLESADEQDIAGSVAVQLFLDRGSTARGGVTTGIAPMAAAGRICRKLDGLPLAIELAAARLSTLSAAEIEAHLTDRFAFLAYRRPAADPRHQALRAAMDWSYDLLPPEDRRVLGELSVFAGSFGLNQVAAVCTAGNQAAALDIVDRLAGKSLVSAEPAEDGTRYRLLETVRQYAADRLAETGDGEAARHRHALAFLSLAERERRLAARSPDHDNFRAALEWALSAGNQAGPRLARALGDVWLARGLLAEAQDWLERALAQRPADQRLRAGLLRLLGAVLSEGGDLERAQAVLSEGSEVAGAAGAVALQGRIRVLLADIRNMQTGRNAEALVECDTAAAVLESEGDLEGLAEALTMAGKLRFWLADTPAYADVLERAIDCARQSGNHRAQMRASHWLAVTFHTLPIPADAAVARTEQLLQEADGDLWAEADLLKPLSILYAYTGRFADARAALERTRSIFAGFGATLALAESAIPAGVVELAVGDPAAAERYLREGYDVLRAMGEQRYVANIANMLAEALYAQGRFDETQQVTEEVQTAPVEPDARAQCWAIQAQLLARRGQFSDARQLMDEAVALMTPVASPWDLAWTLVARAEVSRLVGALDEATADLREALRIYNARRAPSLAARARDALAKVAANPDP